MTQAPAWLDALLTWVTRRFKIDAHYFAKNSIYVALSHGLTIAKGLTTGYLISRLFPAQMYGEYRFVLSITGTIGVLGLSGLPRAISRAVARGDKDIPLHYTIRWYTIFCLVGAAAILGVIPFLGHWQHEDLWPMFLLAAMLFVPINVGTTLFGGIVIGKGKFGMSFKAGLISSILIIIGTLAMLLIHPSAIVLLALVTGIPAMVYLVSLRKAVREFPSDSHRFGILSYGIRLSIADIPMSLSWYLDGLLISGLFGLKELALFSVATMIPEEVKGLIKEFLPLSFSKQAAGTDSFERRMHLTKVVSWLTIIMAIGIGIYLLISPKVMPFLFPLYDPSSIVPVTNAAAIVLITMPATLFAQQLEAQGRAKDVLISQWMSSAVFAIALVILVPLAGLIGALAARGIFRMTYAGYSFYAMWKAPYKTVAVA